MAGQRSRYLGLCCAVWSCLVLRIPIRFQQILPLAWPAHIINANALGVSCAIEFTEQQLHEPHFVTPK